MVLVCCVDLEWCACRSQVKDKEIPLGHLERHGPIIAFFNQVLKHAYVDPAAAEPNNESYVCAIIFETFCSFCMSLIYIYSQRVLHVCL